MVKSSESGEIESMEGVLTSVDLNGRNIMHSNGEEDDDVIMIHEEITDKVMVKPYQSSNGHSVTNNDVRLQLNLKSRETNLIRFISAI
ncbi:unnamed protein product [Trichobilharzia szidati]|nr:unnamed protein product [Trichobilharzia szidati]CAH8820832.1 unnamed protein product [Trichobilharzia szidati]